ncbi:serine hydrolase domain-containing protein [Cytophagaceae bacterium DM2B3-1]|uniref:Serine hydrolase domain-containing protein n=1 Tax=Xanthocytophaga flava TaxID=3048013 RepID=A0ABT7CUK4_9BACT|nr:serine hydrolase domain-containing protein [Xanthocytophaga flavus]MDJ1471540.1 serine hydrolase domain-containing protein [Xanthocytophaga flavus]MDJ1496610.1 serine hydrolase domain-containing protein [Xanthocytophaga flavus]
MKNLFWALSASLFLFALPLSITCIPATQLDDRLPVQTVGDAIDSVLTIQPQKPFNGAILVARGDSVVYSHEQGYANFSSKKLLALTDQFVIGSISKQLTAVVLLQAYDKGLVKLHVPIRRYLPELTHSWADTVTIHHLLTHMHGITALDKPVKFPVGTQYAYSQIGYNLLARIAEQVSGKPFAELSKILFLQCGMRNTFHPDTKGYLHLVEGYTEQANGTLEREKDTFENYPAAGTFISTVQDLLQWNRCLYGGKLLKKKTLALMMTPQKGAVRQHPLFGLTFYGYGVTIDQKDNIRQYGLTGYVPGFISMNFYYPDTKTSIIAWENTVYDVDDLKKTFLYHTGILQSVRKWQSDKK